jgi:hypothetical protein
MGKRGPKPVNGDALLNEEYYWNRIFHWMYSGPDMTRSMSQHRAFAERTEKLERRLKLRKTESDRKRLMQEVLAWNYSYKPLWKALLRARTRGQVRSICSGAKFNSFKRTIKDARVQKMCDYPEYFLAAKRDKRFPRSARPSTIKKRLDYLGRAMAGLAFHIKPGTAVDLLRKAPHVETCMCWKCNSERLTRLYLERKHKETKNEPARSIREGA